MWFNQFLNTINHDIFLLASCLLILGFALGRLANADSGEGDATWAG